MAVEEKILKYDHFLNDVLREDLKKVLQSREVLFENIAAYTQLKQTIATISQLPKEEGIRTQVDIGCNFYVQSHIPDTTYIYINVGLGIHLQLTLPEANIFIEKKLKDIHKDLDISNKSSAKLKGQIKFVMLAISELEGTEGLLNSAQ